MDTSTTGTAFLLSQNTLKNVDGAALIGSVFTRCPWPSLLTDSGFRIIATNPAFLNTSGYAEPDIVGKNRRDLPVLVKKGDEVTRAFEEGRITRGEISARFPAGTLSFEEHCIPVTDDTGKITAFFLSYQNLSDEKYAKLLHDYGERVKEQTLFYATAKLIQDDAKSIEQVLREIVVLIPPGWQYPEVCAARIQFEEINAVTPNYRSTPWNQTKDFVLKGGKRGFVEILYLEEKPFESEGPFLKEERNLINSLAEMIKTYLDRKTGEEVLDKKYREQEKLLHDYGERVKEQTLFYATAKLIQDDSKKWEQILDEIVVLIPPGWQYPEICAARISFEGVTVTTPNYRDTPWRQAQEFTIKGGKRGVVEVLYLEEKPFEAEGPFLKEERNLITSLAEMVKTYLDRKTSEQELEDKFQEIKEIEHYMEHEVAQLAATYIRMGNGDLTLRYEITPPGTHTRATCEQITKMQDAVRVIIANLQKNIRDVNAQMTSLTRTTENALKSLQEASRGIGNVAQNSSRVSTNASRSQEKFGQILRAMGDMNSAVEEITTSMDKVSTLSRNADEIAKSGAERAGDAEKGMGEMARSTDRVHGIVTGIDSQMANISKIVELIRDIANQTNLLALNAAIEAARAGDAGRGFAVVAAEVKSLAGESKNSAEKIEEMINHLRKDTQNATAAMKETKEIVESGSVMVTDSLHSFKKIADAVADVAASASEVAATTQEQAATTQEVTASVNDVAGLVQATAKEAEDSAAATQESAAAIDEISSMVGQVNTVAASALEANRKFRVD
ncbi:MAG: methyl-accepting chemotaxis protein [Methanoregula sp.]|jgi:methyl-accepting chemotaxis protein